MAEVEMTLQVDKEGWVLVPGYVQISPPLPGEGRVLGVKSWSGMVLVMQESEEGPKLYRLILGSPSVWEEVSSGQVQ